MLAVLEYERDLPCFRRINLAFPLRIFGLAVYEALLLCRYYLKAHRPLDLLCPEVIRDMVMVVEDSPKEIAKALQRAQTSFCGSENLPSRLLLSQETDLKA